MYLTNTVCTRIQTNRLLALAAATGFGLTALPFAGVTFGHSAQGLFLAGLAILAICAVVVLVRTATLIIEVVKEARTHRREIAARMNKIPPEARLAFAGFAASPTVDYEEEASPQNVFVDELPNQRPYFQELGCIGLPYDNSSLLNADSPMSPWYQVLQ